MDEMVEKRLATMTERGRLSQLAVSDTGFVFDPQTGLSFGTNETGLRTLNMLKGGCDLDETARSLADEYGIPEEMALSGVESFVKQLGRYL